ncbi:hypothetical protein [Agrobacterium radiobacter]|uniref:hypothetical protein n=1 Tax=Agrobacterium radiobacter TaxID=362 RepID=UPI003CE57928
MATQPRIIVRSTLDNTVQASFEFSAINLCVASARALHFTEIMVWIDGQTIRKLTAEEREALKRRDRETAYAIRDEINGFTDRLAHGVEYLDTAWDQMTPTTREKAKALWTIQLSEWTSLFVIMGHRLGKWCILSACPITAPGEDLPALTFGRPCWLDPIKKAA